MPGDTKQDDPRTSETTASTPPFSDVFDPETSPLRSQATDSLSETLSRLGVSVLVSTYQAGYLVAVRAADPRQLNTQFRRFSRPMGMAHWQGRLAVGTDREVVEF